MFFTIEEISRFSQIKSKKSQVYLGMDSQKSLPVSGDKTEKLKADYGMEVVL